MKRRDFSAALGGTLALAGAGLLVTRPAAAQGGPVEGVTYRKLGEPLPVAPGRIQVLEFFSYGCPHCNAFEPEIETWEKTLPRDVVFQRVPVSPEKFQKLYYTLESLGQVNALQAKVFYAVHHDKQRFIELDDLAAFAEKNGIDRAKFLSTFASFTVAAKVRQAGALAAQYNVDEVPMLSVQGRYVTSPRMAGGTQKSLSTVDFLAQRVRAG